MDGFPHDIELLHLLFGIRQRPVVRGDKAVRIPVQPEEPPVPAQGGDSAVNDALAGLAVLGYSSAEIAPALKKLETKDMSAEQIIKAVLKQMVK